MSDGMADSLLVGLEWERLIWLFFVDNGETVRNFTA